MWRKSWSAVQRCWLALVLVVSCWYWFVWRFWLALGSRRRLLRLTAVLAPAVLRRTPRRLSAKTRITVVPPKVLEQVSAPVTEVPALTPRRWLLLPTVAEPIEEQRFLLVKPDQWSAVAALQALGLNNQGSWLEQVLLREAGVCASEVGLFLVKREVMDEALWGEHTRRRLGPVNWSTTVLFLQLHELYWPKNSRIFAVGNHALGQQGRRIALCVTQGHSTYSDPQLTGGAGLIGRPYSYRHPIAWPWPRPGECWPANSYFLGAPLPREGS